MALNLSGTALNMNGLEAKPKSLVLSGAEDGNKRTEATLNTQTPNLAEGQDFTSIPLTKQKFLNEMEDTLVDCCGDTATFAKVFMPHRFAREFDAQYQEIFRLLVDDSAKKVAIA